MTQPRNISFPPMVLGGAVDSSDFLSAGHGSFCCSKDRDGYRNSALAGFSPPRITRLSRAKSLRSGRACGAESSEPLFCRSLLDQPAASAALLPRIGEQGRPSRCQCPVRRWRTYRAPLPPRTPPQSPAGGRGNEKQPTDARIGAFCRHSPGKVGMHFVLVGDPRSIFLRSAMDAEVPYSVAARHRSAYPLRGSGSTILEGPFESMVRAVAKRIASGMPKARADVGVAWAASEDPRTVTRRRSVARRA